MNYILYDSFRRNNLLPFVYTRPVADIRIGILSIREKWERMLGAKTSTLTEDYLEKKYPLLRADDNVLINGSVLPTKQLAEQIAKLDTGQTLVKGEVILAMRLSAADIDGFDVNEDLIEHVFEGDFLKINNSWDIFKKNAQAILDDFELLTRGRKSAELSGTNFVKGDKKNIFLEEGARLDFAFLNAEEGPIYIGKNAEIMEGAKIRGPFALCERATVKMDAKIYGGTTIGPHSKVGGELNNVVIFGYTNKAHDGFLGNSVLGEWCNLGADTNNSNLKNTYDNVRIWSIAEETFVDTASQFCGLLMGDHSKTGINTMFNTGTVVGVSCNIFGSGYQRNFIPSFSWGGTQGLRTFGLKKAFEVATAVFRRRGREFDGVEQDILTNVYWQEHR
ncbi:MAG: GlmU family protein [Bacteroidales bacterium]|nr:GlmU family protein [Bacteroidales bacterium]MCF6341946.1 GlmU family protein [Bacteroidales bacterium]